MPCAKCRAPGAKECMWRADNGYDAAGQCRCVCHVTDWKLFDQIARLEASLHGWGFAELLAHLLAKEAQERCDQCDHGECTHEAARCAALLLR